MIDGRGFIELPAENKENSQDRGAGEKNVYCISMFHQLHCLAGLNTAFSLLSTNSSSPPPNDDPTISSPQQKHKHASAPEHLMHGFDYLRQAIMCAGDTALEPAAQWKNTRMRLVDGWGVTHSCRNYREVYDFAERNVYMNATGAL